MCSRSINLVEAVKCREPLFELQYAGQSVGLCLCLSEGLEWLPRVYGSVFPAGFVASDFPIIP